MEKISFVLYEHPKVLDGLACVNGSHGESYLCRLVHRVNNMVGVTVKNILLYNYRIYMSRTASNMLHCSEKR